MERATAEQKIEDQKKTNSTIVKKVLNKLITYIQEKNNQLLLIKNPDHSKNKETLANIQGIIGDHQIMNEDDFVGYCKVVHKSMAEYMKKQIKDFMGIDIEPGELVIYDDLTIETGCGVLSRDIGPLYCPGDKKTYINIVKVLEIIKELDLKGDLVIAYINGHEFGHDIQEIIKENLELYLEALGKKYSKIYDVEKIKEALGMLKYKGDDKELKEYKRLITVQTELWADYLSGVYLKHEQNIGNLEEGDVLEAMTASYKVGDDYVYETAGKLIDKVHYTHGSSNERANAFLLGFDQGTLFNSPMKKLFDLYSKEKIDI